ncbi:MAG: hypothetical protein M1814_002495 [Vezdaea aestivalis]|nr:MAG: hypothetical protein M1814_002495 [Vezdaea aestivalis]
MTSGTSTFQNIYSVTDTGFLPRPRQGQYENQSRIEALRENKSRADALDAELQKKREDAIKYLKGRALNGAIDQNKVPEILVTQPESSHPSTWSTAQIEIPKSTKENRRLFFSNIAKQKRAQDQKILARLREREQIAQETADILGIPVDPLSADFDNRDNPHAGDPDHQMLVNIKGFLSGADSHLSEDFDRKVKDVADFVRQLGRQRSDFDQNLRREVEAMLVVHTHRAAYETKQFPDKVPSYHNVPRHSTRLPVKLSQTEISRIRELETPDDRPPFTRTLPKDYYEAFEAMKSETGLEPNSLVANETDAYLRTDHFNKKTFEYYLSKVPAHVQPVVRRGRQRQFIERALNIHASASEQNHVGQMCHRVPTLAKPPIPPAHEPKLFVERPTAKAVSQADPLQWTKEFLESQQDRKSLQKIVAEQGRFKQSIDSASSLTTHPLLAPGLIESRLRTTVYRLGGPLGAALFNLPLEQQYEIALTGNIDLVKNVSVSKKLHPLAKYVIYRAFLCLKWSDRRKIKMLEKFIPEQANAIPYADDENLTTPLAAEEMTFLKEVFREPRISVDLDTMELATRLINELRAFLIQYDISEDPIRFRSLISLERKALDEMSYDLQLIQDVRGSRFMPLPALSKKLVGGAADQAAVNTFLEGMTEEQQGGGVDRRLNLSTFWDFSRWQDPVSRATIWFSLYRKPSARPLRYPLQPLAQVQAPPNPLRLPGVEKLVFPKPGEGKLIPREIQDFDPMHNELIAVKPLRPGETYAAKQPCMFPFGDTPYHEALTSARIHFDLAGVKIGDDDDETPSTSGANPLSKEHLFDLPDIHDRVKIDVDHLLRFGVFTTASIHPAFHFHNAFGWSPEESQASMNPEDDFVIQDEREDNDDGGDEGGDEDYDFDAEDFLSDDELGGTDGPVAVGRKRSMSASAPGEGRPRKRPRTA